MYVCVYFYTDLSPADSQLETFNWEAFGSPRGALSGFQGWRGYISGLLFAHRTLLT